MEHHSSAGKLVNPDTLVNLPHIISLYYLEKPDISHPRERVSFGTSGHRGSSQHRSFTESHIYAITQAICDYRKKAGITGPLFLGKDTHALSDPAEKTAIEVLAANDIPTYIDHNFGFTPTPVISHAIL
ncbi:MAG: phosphoglucomutase, alpha-D-glucose phosphate-specific, partial [Calditrichaeota bacterium]